MLTETQYATWKSQNFKQYRLYWHEGWREPGNAYLQLPDSVLKQHSMKRGEQ